MVQTKYHYPESLLFVCEGNTCRSPMAEALARRRWPKCRIMSAGINVAANNCGAADKAVTVMSSYGLDISGHQPTPITKVDADTFQFIVALDKGVKRELIEKHSIPEVKIKDIFVDDPIGDDIAQYAECAGIIAKGLGSHQFSN